MSGFLPSLDDRIATVAACSPIGLPAKQKTRVEVLTPGEWNRLARWLVDTNLRPADLLFESIAHELELSNLESRLIQKARLIADRASTTLSAIEEIQDQGLWIRCRADTDYPAKWKKRLKVVAPPVVFGMGDIRMLGETSIAIVGSRDVTPALAETAGAFGALVANAQLVVISGAARGTDRFGMIGALDAKGRSAGVLAGSLQRISRDDGLRDHIANDRLCLVSQVHPTAGFTVGNAMARNRLIYALSDLAIVISTSEGTGGTWLGAVENLHRKWAPIAVWSGVGAPEANARLVELGAYPLNEVLRAEESVDRLIHIVAVHQDACNQEIEKPRRLIQETPPPIY